MRSVGWPRSSFRYCCKWPVAPHDEARVAPVDSIQRLAVSAELSRPIHYLIPSNSMGLKSGLCCRRSLEARPPVSGLASQRCEGHDQNEIRFHRVEHAVGNTRIKPRRASSSMRRHVEGDSAMRWAASSTASTNRVPSPGRRDS
jgi:hypothetical protein